MRLRLAASALSLFGLSLAQAYAQGVSQPDPGLAIVSPENIEPVMGALSLNVQEFRLGDASDPLPIEFVRSYRTLPMEITSSIDPLGLGWTHNLSIGAHYVAGPLGSNMHSMDAVIGKKSYRFSALLNDGQWTYWPAAGASAESVVIAGTTTTIVTSPDGYKYYFPQDEAHAVANSTHTQFGPSSVLTAMVDKIVAPNGETLTFYYAGTGKGSNRIEGVRHSRGYGVIFKYLAPASMTERSAEKQIISQVVLADSLCPTFPTGCDETNFRKLNYSYVMDVWNHSRLLKSSRNLRSEETVYDYVVDGVVAQNNNQLLSIARPAVSSSPFVSFSYVSPTWGIDRRVVKSVTLNGQTTSFTYPPVPTSSYCPAPPWETVRTDPAGGTTRFGYELWLDGEPDGIQWCSGTLATKVTDPNGHVKTYEYAYPDQWKRLTDPEGGYTENSFDDRANIIKTVRVAKPGSGLTDITVSTAYPACTAANFRICNRPVQEVDAGGGQTDYVWSEAHGGLISKKQPADPAGNRPEVAHEYTAFTGSDGAIFYLPSSQTEKVSATESVVTGFEYSPANGYRLKGKTVTAGGQTLRTCYGYDAAGNRISETKPAADLAGCP